MRLRRNVLVQRSAGTDLTIDRANKRERNRLCLRRYPNRRGRWLSAYRCVGRLQRLAGPEMRIEKVSRIVTVSPPYGSGNQTSTRRVLMSLPRIRWLERDGDNTPPEPPPVEDEIATIEKKAFPFYAYHPLYPREKEAHELHKAGKTVLEIAGHMSIPQKTVRTYLTCAKKKLEFQASQK